ncbi:MAG: HIT family protein [Gammaproteobacteria bacterium]
MSVESCIFCHLDRPVVAANALAIAFRDAYPVSPGHTLVTPRRHVRTILDATPEEYAACFELAREVARQLAEELTPDGFNLGVNVEAAGGQSVWHAHIHVIPRYTGDNPDPLGGVRNVIPRRREPVG